jgi:hypothetical protein
MEERRSYSLPVLFAVLLLLPVLYIAGYLALLSPQPGSINWAGITVAERRVAGYRWGGQKAEVFFRPVHEVDRLVRHNYWYYSEADQQEIIAILELAR